MGDLQAKVAYMRGLLSGFGGDPNAKENRLWEEVTQVLDALVAEVRDLRSAQEDLEDYVQALDEDLYTVESVLFGPDEEEEETADYETIDLNEETPALQQQQEDVF